MASVATMLSARRGRGKADWTDWFSYGYLLLGLVLMFGPVVWFSLLMMVLLFGSFAPLAWLTRLLESAFAKVTAIGAGSSPSLSKAARG